MKRKICTMLCALMVLKYQVVVVNIVKSKSRTITGELCEPAPEIWKTGYKFGYLKNGRKV